MQTAAYLFVLSVFQITTEFRYDALHMSSEFWWLNTNKKLPILNKSDLLLSHCIIMCSKTILWTIHELYKKNVFNWIWTMLKVHYFHFRASSLLIGERPCPTLRTCCGTWPRRDVRPSTPWSPTSTWFPTPGWIWCSRTSSLVSGNQSNVNVAIHPAPTWSLSTR